MTRSKILFVDDDVQILSSFRTLFRQDRHRWDVATACGPLVALDELGKQSFDVVVSDMRMPDMTGAQLLAIIRERFPHTRRIMLSGSADREDFNAASTIANVLLAKPCDSKTLRMAISELLAMPIAN